jgi:hypothetical protein
MDASVCSYGVALCFDVLVRGSQAAKILNVGSWVERAIAADLAANGASGWKAAISFLALRPRLRGRCRALEREPTRRHALNPA